MRTENYRYLVGLIAAHDGRRVVGRTRLQKEVKLLQRLGFPTDYAYMIHFYGPYSEGLNADIGLLSSAGLVREEMHVSKEGNPYYTMDADPRTQQQTCPHSSRKFDSWNSLTRSYWSWLQRTMLSAKWARIIRTHLLAFVARKAPNVTAAIRLPHCVCSLSLAFRRINRSLTGREPFGRGWISA